MAGKEKGKFSPPAVGGSALLVAFAVLCLTVFALLSLSTVRANVRLAEASRGAVEAYYEADVRAEEVFARLRRGEAAEDLEPAAAVSEYPDRGETAYRYTVPISDTQELQVELLRRGDRWTVERWQASPIEAEELDESLDVWDGRDF